MTLRDGLRLLGCVLLCNAAGIVGGLATQASVDTWYLPRVEKPAWAPPSWVFAPVWTLLYTLMGTALFLVWRHLSFQPAETRRALTVFAVHLAANVAWSFAFFGARSPALGLVVIVVLLALIIATMGAFARVSKAAAWLLAPYLAWVAFATALNAAIWRLNP
jgi:translocator protein